MVKSERRIREDESPDAFVRKLQNVVDKKISLKGVCPI